jgi:hypothetical protein
VSGLLAANSKPEAEVHVPSPRASDSFDRMVCGVVCGRAALLALAATVLPAGPVLAGAVLLEVGLFAFLASRAHT